MQWRYLLPFAAIALATVLGIARNTAQFSPVYGTDGYAVNVFWSIFNIAVLVIACAVCVEVPRRRVEERFNSGENAIVRLVNGTQVPCVAPRHLSRRGTSHDRLWPSAGERPGITPAFQRNRSAVYPGPPVRRAAWQ